MPNLQVNGSRNHMRAGHDPSQVSAIDAFRSTTSWPRPAAGWKDMKGSSNEVVADSWIVEPDRGDEEPRKSDEPVNDDREKDLKNRGRRQAARDWPAVKEHHPRRQRQSERIQCIVSRIGMLARVSFCSARRLPHAMSAPF